MIALVRGPSTLASDPLHTRLLHADHDEAPHLKFGGFGLCEKLDSAMLGCLASKEARKQVSRLRCVEKFGLEAQLVDGISVACAAFDATTNRAGSDRLEVPKVPRRKRNVSAIQILSEDGDRAASSRVRYTLSIVYDKCVCNVRGGANVDRCACLQRVISASDRTVLPCSDAHALSAVDAVARKHNRVHR